MQKTRASIFALLITILIAINIFFLTPKTNLRQEIKIERVIDGDTIETSIGTIRLLNINSPERKYKTSQLSKEYLEKFVNSSLEAEIIESDKYGRILARIYSPEYLNLDLVSKGLASKFLVHEGELSDFKKAEEEAIENENGIWQHSDLFFCLEAEINEKEEKIIIINNCNNINMLGFILKDESRKTYVFGNNELKRGQVLILHSNEGEDNETDIFWNSNTNIWNNERDTLYLFDKEENIVFYASYGY